MSASTHLTRYPNSRGSTIASKQLIEAKTAQLRAENKAVATRPRWSILSLIAKLVRKVLEERV